VVRSGQENILHAADWVVLKLTSPLEGGMVLVLDLGGDLAKVDGRSLKVVDNTPLESNVPNALSEFTSVEATPEVMIETRVEVAVAVISMGRPGVIEAKMSGDVGRAIWEFGAKIDVLIWDDNNIPFCTECVKM